MSKVDIMLSIQKSCFNTFFNSSGTESTNTVKCLTESKWSTFIWENGINVSLYLTRNFSLFAHRLDLPWTTTNILKPKSAQSAQPFSSFNQTNEQQFIFIYIDILYC